MLAFTNFTLFYFCKIRIFLIQFCFGGMNIVLGSAQARILSESLRTSSLILAGSLRNKDPRKTKQRRSYSAIPIRLIILIETQ